MEATDELITRALAEQKDPLNVEKQYYSERAKTSLREALIRLIMLIEFDDDQSERQ